MPTGVSNFPDSKDTASTTLPAVDTHVDRLNSPNNRSHDQLHDNVGAIIAAIEDKLGYSSSNPPGGNAVLFSDTPGQSKWSQTGQLVPPGGITHQILTAVTGSVPLWSSTPTIDSLTTVSGVTVGTNLGVGGALSVAGAATLSATLDVTGTIKARAYAAHNVLISEGVSDVVSIAPSATPGVPFISAGSSSDPTYGTALVVGGGTGQVTLLAHGVLVGAGTSAITQLAVGATNSVLQGASGTDPAFTTTPTLAGLTLATTPLAYGSGGTGATAFTQHGVVVAGASALTTIAPSTSGNVLLSNGTDWTSAALSGLPPSGTAGGDLSGTYPNPTVKGASSAAGFSVTGGRLITSTALLRSSPFTLPTWEIYNDGSNWAGISYGVDTVQRWIIGKNTSSARIAFGYSTALDGTGTFTETASINQAGYINTIVGYQLSGNLVLDVNIGLLRLNAAEYSGDVQVILNSNGSALRVINNNAGQESYITVDANGGTSQFRMNTSGVPKAINYYDSVADTYHQWIHGVADYLVVNNGGAANFIQGLGVGMLPFDKFLVHLTTNQNIAIRSSGGTTAQIYAVNDTNVSYVPMLIDATNITFNSGSGGTIQIEGGGLAVSSGGIGALGTGTVNVSGGYYVNGIELGYYKLLGQGSSGNNQNITNATADITGLSVTCTPDGTHNVKITVTFPQAQSSNGTSEVGIILVKDGVAIDESDMFTNFSGAVCGPLVMMYIDGTPTAASHTYKVQGFAPSGVTLSTVVSVPGVNSIIVEQVG